MRVIYATVYRCDCCGSQDTAIPDSPYVNAPIPDGWLIYSPALVSLHIESVDGRRFSDFCPNCQRKPAAVLLADVIAYQSNPENFK